MQQLGNSKMPFKFLISHKGAGAAGLLTTHELRNLKMVLTVSKKRQRGHWPPSHPNHNSTPAHNSTSARGLPFVSLRVPHFGSLKYSIGLSLVTQNLRKNEAQFQRWDVRQQRALVLPYSFGSLFLSSLRVVCFDKPFLFLLSRDRAHLIHSNALNKHLLDICYFFCPLGFIVRANRGIDILRRQIVGCNSDRCTHASMDWAQSSSWRRALPYWRHLKICCEQAQAHKCAVTSIDEEHNKDERCGVCTCFGVCVCVCVHGCIRTLMSSCP